ncbi:AI-2E family transporter [Flavihumibacter petaseus]|uniref:AI-2E family transporter n=1 Tax=Flavihumibacter petaseus NBRC 106054 TaxID=1220578 RepID=A0A0E9MXZ5_9BACT|nr:AI-2E family transporter [Flavihumibacter petaseus]GAO42602.1 hypothetical protein FPE01S_01_16170 [Flavihumibacter petaseus NBRC 106054]
MFGNLIRKSTRKSPVTSLETPSLDNRPFYFKATMILLGLFLLFDILVLLRDILVPICFAALIGILINPLTNRLILLKVPRPVAIILSILIAAIFVAAIVIFISSQLASFSELAPQFRERGAKLLQEAMNWIKSTFNVPIRKQQKMLDDALQNGQAYLGQTLSTLMGVLGVVVLLPIYTFLLLYYKPLLLRFFYDVIDDKHEGKVTEVLNESKSAVQSYIVGLLIETVIVAIMNSVALLLLGVKYAVLIGALGAILNLIPYIGGIIAITLPVLMAVITGDGSLTTPLLVIGSYLLIQFIDNNILVPKIVSSKVEVNAFASIVVVLLGGALWGVPGMFLSIPFIATCKIIFDRIEILQPWGRLLGTNMDDHFTLKVQEPTPDQDQVTEVQDASSMPTQTSA